MTTRLAAATLGFALACTLPTAGLAQPKASSLAPAGWDDGIRLKALPDKNPDPHVVEVDLTARVADVEVAPGKTVRAWTYDGGIPGPLIRAHVGDRVIVHFTNDAAAADDHPLARRARADRDGRRARHLAARGEARRVPSPTTSWCATPGCTGITRT